ncbi:MAG: PEP-CTERM sorting domain-containing protein, partial [Pirellulales bacterium]
ADDADVWTGSDYQGFGIADATLGAASGDSEIGQLAIDTTWLEFAVRPQINEVTLEKTFYALSSPITVPEPTTLALLGSALLLMGAHHFVRRRRRT